MHCIGLIHRGRRHPFFTAVTRESHNSRPKQDAGNEVMEKSKTRTAGQYSHDTQQVVGHSPGIGCHTLTGRVCLKHFEVPFFSDAI